MADQLTSTTEPPARDGQFWGMGSMTKKRQTDEQQEAEVARRHAAIARDHAAELAANPTRDLGSLNQQMKAMRDHLDGIPESHEFTVNALDDLDDCRIECNMLKNTVESILESLRGN